MYQLVDSTEEKGHYNVAPKGWRPITESEFAQSKFFAYAPKEMEYRQLIRLDDGTPMEKGLSVTMFHMHDNTGFAIHADYWGGKLQYFAFGCDHKYRELSVTECKERGIQHWGQCWHVYFCDICSHVNAHDSSD